MGELINKMNFKIESYGCQMNIADSELVVGILQKAGHKQVQDFDQAELVIFNTCSVREHAEQRVLGRIASVLAYKKQKERFFVGVIGCMAQRMQGELFDNGAISWWVWIKRHLARGGAIVWQTCEPTSCVSVV